MVLAEAYRLIGEFQAISGLVLTPAEVAQLTSMSLAAYRIGIETGADSEMIESPDMQAALRLIDEPTPYVALPHPHPFGPIR